MEEKEPICEKCENLMKIMTDHDTRTVCLNAGFLSIGVITKCSHFKAKPKDNKELKEQTEKATEKKGQNIPEEDLANNGIKPFRR